MVARPQGWGRATFAFDGGRSFRRAIEKLVRYCRTRLGGCRTPSRAQRSRTHPFWPLGRCELLAREVLERKGVTLGPGGAVDAVPPVELARVALVGDSRVASPCQLRPGQRQQLRRFFAFREGDISQSCASARRVRRPGISVAVGRLRSRSSSQSRPLPQP